MSFEALAWAWKAETGAAGRKLVLVGLAQFANDNHEAWPSQKTLADRTEQSERTVRAHLDWLENAGLITRHHRKLADGKRTSDCYILNVESHRQFSPPAIFATGKKQQKNDESHRRNLPPNLHTSKTESPESICAPENEKPEKHKALTTLEQYRQQLKASGEKFMPETDPLFDYADDVGLPHDWIALAWLAFRKKYEGSGKRYKDWRAVFRTAVREDWLKLWAIARDGSYYLTTAGKMIERERDARATAA